MRKVAIGIACLAVTAAFSGCGKDGGDDDDGGGGGKKSELAGRVWSCTMARLVYRIVGGSYTYTYETVMDSYRFYDDGTFIYLPYDDRLVYYDGKYSTSNGKIHFKNVNRRSLESHEATTVYGADKDIEMNYEIGKDANGEYLLTGNLQHFTTEHIASKDKYMKGEAITK